MRKNKKEELQELQDKLGIIPDNPDDDIQFKKEKYFTLPIAEEHFTIVYPLLLQCHYSREIVKPGAPKRMQSFRYPGEKVSIYADAALVTMNDSFLALRYPEFDDFPRNPSNSLGDSDGNPAICTSEIIWDQKPYILVGRDSGRIELLDGTTMQAKQVYNEGELHNSGRCLTIDVSYHLKIPTFLAGFEDGSVLCFQMNLPEVEWPDPNPPPPPSDPVSLADLPSEGPETRDTLTQSTFSSGTDKTAGMPAAATQPASVFSRDGLASSSSPSPSPAAASGSPFTHSSSPQPGAAVSSMPIFHPITSSYLASYFVRSSDAAKEEGAPPSITRTGRRLHQDVRAIAMTANESLFKSIDPDIIRRDSQTLHLATPTFVAPTINLPAAYSKSKEDASSSSSASMALRSELPADRPSDFHDFQFYSRNTPLNPIGRWSLSYHPIHCLRINPNPAIPLVAFALDDGYVVLFNLLSNSFHCAFATDAGAASYVAWSSDGRLLAVAGEANTVMLYSEVNKTPRPLCRLRGHEGWVHRMIFDPSPPYTTSASGGGLARVYQLVTTGDDGRIFSYAFNLKNLDGEIVNILKKAQRKKEVKKWRAILREMEEEKRKEQAEAELERRRKIESAERERRRIRRERKIKLLMQQGKTEEARAMEAAYANGETTTDSEEEDDDDYDDEEEIVKISLAALGKERANGSASASAADVAVKESERRQSEGGMGSGSGEPSKNTLALSMAPNEATAGGSFSSSEARRAERQKKLLSLVGEEPKPTSGLMVSGNGVKFRVRIIQPVYDDEEGGEQYAEKGWAETTQEMEARDRNHMEKEEERKERKKREKELESEALKEKEREKEMLLQWKRERDNSATALNSTASSSQNMTQAVSPLSVGSSPSLVVSPASSANLVGSTFIIYGPLSYDILPFIDPTGEIVNPTHSPVSEILWGSEIIALCTLNGSFSFYKQTRSATLKTSS
eukprot:MONOS_5348.1-p1 / transcript=MONOS_5348.1 / gene=MONOS_5348 / organism=Monocercomonoides_exilis_PA203 / gene_product=unspecified product / transcript_product=unspecified product / location=Mono_scaffold00154:76297-80264(+) / protein_length=962 / sequence_SO=supercontig / SO=protein_coding / is_pseudo=false